MSAVPARIAGVSLALTLALSAAPARQDADPLQDGKRASEWVKAIQGDPSARKRALAATALGKAWADHQYKDALKNLGRSLRVDSSAAVRAQCAAVIAGLKPEAAQQIASELVEQLKEEKEPRVRKELAVAMSRFPDIAARAVAPLAAVLKDADPAARAAAAAALARAGSEAKDAAPALIPLLDDPDKAARSAAIFALGRITPDNPSFVAAALVKRYGEEKEAELRREAVVSLKLLGEKSEPVVAALARALADPDADTQAAAVAALGTFGTAARPAADALLKMATTAKDKGLRVDAVRAFGSALGPGLKDRLKDLIRVMEADPDFEVRVAAVDELGALGPQVKDDKEAMAALRTRLSDPQVKVREVAAAAVRRVEKKPEKAPGKSPEKKP
jgi:HEAT repeat protein